MRFPRFLLAILLSMGVVAGYGSALGLVDHAPCESTPAVQVVAPAAPAPAVPAP